MSYDSRVSLNCMNRNCFFYRPSGSHPVLVPCLEGHTGLGSHSPAKQTAGEGQETLIPKRMSLRSEIARNGLEKRKPGGEEDELLLHVPTRAGQAGAPQLARDHSSIPSFPITVVPVAQSPIIARGTQSHQLAPSGNVRILPMFCVPAPQPRGLGRARPCPDVIAIPSSAVPSLRSA